MAKWTLRIVVAAGALGWAPGAQAQTTVTILDQTGDVGLGPALAVDGTGRGLVAYYDRAQSNLKVARCRDVRCTSAVVTTIDSAGDVGQFASVAFGSDGRGVISYADLTAPALKVAHCNDDACASASIATVEPILLTGRTAMAIGTDGLPLIAYVSDPDLRIAHCSNAACTSSARRSLGLGGPDATLVIAADGWGLMATQATADGASGITHCGNLTCSILAPANPPLPIFHIVTRPTALAVAGDGRPLMASFYQEDPFAEGLGAPLIQEARVSRCLDSTCTGLMPAFGVLDCCNPPDIAVAPNGFGWFAHAAGPAIRLRTCLDAGCSTSAESCAVVSPGGALALERAGDGVPLIAFHREGGGLGVAHGVTDPCPTPRLDVNDAIGIEAGSMLFPVRLAVVSAAPVTVSYATVSGTGTADAGADYVPVAGTLTFAPGQTLHEVAVLLVADGEDEPDQTFVLSLSSPSGAIIGDAYGRGTIVDADPTELAAGDCEAQEGDAGTSPCTMTVSLVHGPTTQPVTVQYATGGGSAAAGTDYTPASGTLTFSVGTSARTIPLGVIGDASVERDEAFFVTLSNPGNAFIADGQGEAQIRDDDAQPLTSLELSHGARVSADLATRPGPVPDQDVYGLAQPPYSSWEAIVDEVSGDLAPGLRLERLAEDNATVAQTAPGVGTGSARSLRWQMRSGLAQTRQHVRVSSTSCTTACGADDTYRLRLYETTGRIARFNNTATQVTVVILQNATAGSVEANADFWDAAGTKLTSIPVSLAPRAISVLATAQVPALAGRAGSITVTHDGGYGALAGKAVSLEPSAGFSFDSPMNSRPR